MQEIYADRNILIGKSKVFHYAWTLVQEISRIIPHLLQKNTGGKEPLPLDSIAEECKRVLNEISDELRTRAAAHTENVVVPLTDLNDVEDGKIYEMAFNGTDAHAETIEDYRIIIPRRLYNTLRTRAGMFHVWKDDNSQSNLSKTY